MHCISSAIAEGLPRDIQWMPPGRHKINATQGDKPYEAEIMVDALTANLMQSILEEMLAKAKAGQADRPYIDFNHDDREAAGHPVKFFWAGDDPQTGGVRMELEWTAPGADAVRGRAFRRFSPSFVPDEDGRVIGTAVNMGGLVNRAGFKAIQPIWAKAAPEDGAANSPHTTGGQPPINNTKETMTDNTMENRVAALETALQTVNAKLSTSDAENLALKTQLATVQANAEVQAKQFAAERVRQAVAAGKIPPQNTDLIEKWTNIITVDAKNAELLEALPANPALQTVTAKDAGTAGAAAPQAAASTATNEPAFVVKARAFGQAKGIKSELEAQTVYASTPEGGELYRAYRSNYANKPQTANN